MLPIITNFNHKRNKRNLYIIIELIIVVTFLIFAINILSDYFDLNMYFALGLNIFIISLLSRSYINAILNKD